MNAPDFAIFFHVCEKVMRGFLCRWLLRTSQKVSCLMEGAFLEMQDAVGYPRGIISPF
jgi:hypothetical protein